MPPNREEKLAKQSSASGIADFMGIMKRGLKKCLDPSMSCTNEAINAHSVQNATALGLLEENGHVTTIKQSVKGGEPQISFEQVGRNQASTFTALCNHHDTEFFKPIDTRPLSLDDAEQLFLLAYRSVTRELHSVLEGAGRIQTAFLQLVDRGEIPKDEVSSEGIEAVQHMLKAWGTWRYRYQHFDENLVKGRFNNILHTNIILQHDTPNIAASSFFSVKDKVWGRPFPAAIVNIVPLSTHETAVIVSYAREHSGIVRRFFAPIVMEKDVNRQQLLLSHMIVDRMENFFIRTSVVDGWTAEKKQFILSSFIATVFTGVRIPFDDRLMLLT